MCLTIWKTDKIRIAKKDITCYKVIFKSSKKNYRTIFRKAIVHLGEKYVSELTRTVKWGDHTINKGLHSYSTKRECISDLKHDIRYNYSYLEEIGVNRIMIVKCIIPKGSYYYKGRFEPCKAYASDNLLYTEEIIWQPKTKNNEICNHSFNYYSLYSLDY